MKNETNLSYKGASGGVRSSTYYSIYKSVLKNTARNSVSLLCLIAFGQVEF